ncbi:MAG: ATP-binding protein [Bifidobacteriaceae bacterium]|nr:ATP-binding protein [Bifidobacteriaceae bacterium]
MSLLVDRPLPLAALRRWRDKPIIKVVTGVRRCGKSTLLELFRDELTRTGVAPDQIVHFNLEDLEVQDLATDHRALHRAVLDRRHPTAKTYVFLDEPQTTPEFELAVDSLHLRPELDLYLTGSNAQMLSGDLATRLAGRHVEIQLTPLSFAEFSTGWRQRGFKDAEASKIYSEFTRWGSFPFALTLAPDTTAIDDYLDGLVNTILLKDVAVRQRVANAALLRDVVAFLLSNVGSATSLRRVANALTSAGRGPSPNTIESYLSGLVSAYLMYPLEPRDLAGLRHLDAPKKYYAVDPGLRAAVIGRRRPDTGHMLENTVFLELLRRHRHVWSARAGGGEIDFVAAAGDQLIYIQVAATVRDEATLARELAPLAAVPDHHPKLLLTLDEDPPTSHRGIRQLNALDWLLGNVT